MFKVESIPLQAPAITDVILQLYNVSTIPPYLVVENLSATLSVGIIWKESDDGTTWTDVVGSSQSINPLQASGQIVVSNKRLLALFAQGNVPLLVSVVRQNNAIIQPI